MGALGRGLPWRSQVGGATGAEPALEESGGRGHWGGACTGKNQDSEVGQGCGRDLGDWRDRWHSSAESQGLAPGGRVEMAGCRRYRVSLGVQRDMAL